MMRLVIYLILLLLPVSLWADAFVRFEEGGKIGLKDEQGKVIIPASFDALGWSDGNFSVIGQVTGYKLKDKWGVINLQKRFITSADFETMVYSGGDRLIASRNINSFMIKYGCLDLEGNVKVPFRYDGIKISGLRAVVFIKNGPTYEYGLIDLNDKGIIPLRYRQIHPIGTLRYAVENDSSKTALFSEAGNRLTPFVIDSISSFRKGNAVIYQNFAQGLIDREGEVRVKPVYREVNVDQEGEISIREFDEWKILDGSNHELKKINADRLEKSGSDLYRMQLASKTGLLNPDLKITLPIIYDFVGPENHGNRKIGIKKHFGVIKKNHQSILPVRFDSLVLDDNFIRVAQFTNNGLSWSLYDTFGVQKTSSFYEFLGSFTGKFFPVKKRGYWGALNRYGEESINCVFDSLLDLKDELIAVKFRGQFGVIDQGERWLLAPQPNRVMLVNRDLYLEIFDGHIFLKTFKGEVIYFTANVIVAGDGFLKEISDGQEKHISYQGIEIDKIEVPEGARPVSRPFAMLEGMQGFQKDGKYGFVDGHGRLRIANRYDDIGEFREGLAPIKLIGKWGFVSLDDKIVVNPNYESVESFINGLAIVWRNKQGGLIDQRGDNKLPLRYDAISRLPDGTFLLKIGTLLGMADQKGNVLIETRFDYLQNLGNGFAIAGREGKFGLVTLQGLSTVPMIYDQLIYDSAKNQYLGWKKAEWKRATLIKKEAEASDF